MNAATRAPKIIKESQFDIYCKEDSDLDIFSFVSGQLNRLDVTFTSRNNGLKSVVVPATSDGYYFVRSARSIQSLKKGNVEYKLFFFDPRQRENLLLLPESFDYNGDKIGYNDCTHIGYGIYAITPLVLTPSIVKILGKVFYSFPNSKEVECPEQSRAASTVSLGADQDTTTISIGGDDPSIEAKESNVGLSVEQTIFKV